VGEKADADIVQRVSDLERPPVWMGALYLVMIGMVVLGFRLLRKSVGRLVNNLSGKRKPKPQDEYLPDWLEGLTSHPDSGD